jgi:hypothetical protein
MLFTTIMIMGMGIGLASCGGGSCADPNDPSGVSTSTDPLNQENCDPTGVSASAAAAISLTNALTFNNGGAIVIEGDFPGNTSSANEEGEVALSPGGSTTISTVDTNPTDPTDPVVASLVWMDGADSFVTLPASGADSNSGGTLNNTFTVDPSVCDNLCDIVHQVKCYEAAQTQSGVITQANLTTVMLECTGSGDPSQCPNVSSQSGGGGAINCTSVCTLALTSCDMAGPDTSVSDCVSECQKEQQVDPAQYNEAMNCLSSNGGLNCNAIWTCAELQNEQYDFD